jgi:hypothetical protein
MTKEQAEFFKQAIINDDLETENDIIRENYSGRGMYGKTTFAVVVDSVCDLVSALLRQAQEDPESIPDVSTFTLRQDNMGLGVVLY